MWFTSYCCRLSIPKWKCSGPRRKDGGCEVPSASPRKAVVVCERGGCPGQSLLNPSKLIRDFEGK